jgi:hypothetical protein
VNTNLVPEWVIEQQIREAAYYKWQEAGCPDGFDDHFWVQAEREIRDAYDINV